MFRNKQSPLKLTEVETSQGSLLVPYEVRRSRQSRTIRLSLGRDNQALLSVPWRCPLTEAMRFLRSQGDWLEEQLKRRPAKVSLLEFLQKHPRLHALGTSLRLSFGFSAVRSFTVYSLESGEIDMRIKAGTDTEAEVFSLVRAFAAEVISLRTHELAEQCGVKVGRVTTRDQSTRWGSCSSHGTVSLNWRLVLLRPELQDHIIYHELAHLTEMNHSPRFWQLLEKYDPRTASHNSQLNPAAARLMPVGR